MRLCPRLDSSGPDERGKERKGSILQVSVLEVQELLCAVLLAPQPFVSQQH